MLLSRRGRESSHEELMSNSGCLPVFAKCLERTVMITEASLTGPESLTQRIDYSPSD